MIYLDHNATAPVLSEVRIAMIDALSHPLNPSSVHSFGRKAKSLMEESRKKISNMLGIDLRRDGYNLVFTGSGTEANNLVMSRKRKALISNVEHPSILRHKDYNDNIDILPVDQNCIVRLDLLEEWMSRNQSGFVSIMMANNETGVIQPMKEIAKLVHKYNGKVHSDLVQAAGKIKIDLADLGLDFATISGHKFGGPVGVGALVYKDKHRLEPHIIGGGQERGIRAGTENIAAIAGMGVAASYLPKENNLRNMFESKIAASCKEAIFFGQNVERLPNTSMIAMPGVAANQQLIALDIAGIAVSSGSACSSGKVKTSHVLAAMGVSSEVADCAIRVSFGNGNTEADVDKLAEVWTKIWKKQ